jgi:hypothetical protein
VSPRRLPSLETMFAQFRAQRGLYILGAGASAGEVPLTGDLMRDPAIQVITGGCFPAEVPTHSILGSRLIAAGCQLTSDVLYPGREFRPGTPDIPIKEIAVRMQDSFGEYWLRHLLAAARHAGRISANYAALCKFKPGTIANYNHDGVATDICGEVHRVIEVHGSVRPGYGDKEFGAWVYEARHYSLPVIMEDLLMCVPERLGDPTLHKRLLRTVYAMPEFLAVIGFSFGEDDAVSLDFYTRALRHFQGVVYVIDPKPDHVAEMLAECLKSDHVYSIQAYWNVLTRAMTTPREGARSLRHQHERLLDRFGSAGSRIIGYRRRHDFT